MVNALSIHVIIALMEKRESHTGSLAQGQAKERRNGVQARREEAGRGCSVTWKMARGAPYPTGSHGSPACRCRIVGLLSLYNWSQFLIISLSLSLLIDVDRYRYM